MYRLCLAFCACACVAVISFYFWHHSITRWRSILKTFAAAAFVWAFAYCTTRSLNDKSKLRYFRLRLPSFSTSIGEFSAPAIVAFSSTTCWVSAELVEGSDSPCSAILKPAKSVSYPAHCYLYSRVLLLKISSFYMWRNLFTKALMDIQHRISTCNNFRSHFYMYIFIRIVQGSVVLCYVISGIQRRTSSRKRLCACGSWFHMLLYMEVSKVRKFTWVTGRQCAHASVSELAYPCRYPQLTTKAGKDMTITDQNMTYNMTHF